MEHTRQKPQWEQAADAVAALGGKATRNEVWEYLKQFRPDLPFSTVTADLNAVSVNAPSRTSYHTGRKPRRTDTGDRHDRLFKVGVGEGAHYVTYDPAVHGVWEIHPDPAATSTHKTSIRRVEAALPSLVVELSDGAIRPGNSFFPVRPLDGDFFPASMLRARDPDGPGVPAHFTTDAGTAFDSDIYRAANTGYLHNRSAARAYYLATQARAGDRLRFEKRGEGQYHISHLPAATTGLANDDAPAPEGPQEPRMTPVNKILFGPPGTGKTYHTINETLDLLDPEFLAAHASDRAALKARFDALADAGRVRFVTFHQSFSYEDFVEGIRASTDEDTGALHYEVEDGVFKQLCEAARSRTLVDADTDAPIDLAGRRIWKVSLGDAGTEGHVFEECMEQGIALMGFGYGTDLTGVSSREEILQRVQAAGGKIEADAYAVTALDLFVRRMKVGDLVLVTHGNLKFRAIGEVTGDYFHKPAEPGEHYVQARPVRWLRQYDPPRPYADLMENRFSQMTIYELRPGSINLDRLAGLLAPEQTAVHGEFGVPMNEPESRVLIIDEINRGNVSRIFGELITLIEPSKRQGCAEALEVTLPYSKQRFGVPANLHIIGTMNTADRSLAGLDVALRRRFEFVEMLPDPAALAGIVIEGIAVDKLLATINRRIEVLLGRDFMLGHANFMALRAAPTLDGLAGVFRRQVLPLLQEYFFEDWQKIAWVLNDHRKPQALRFLQQADSGLAELLGPDVELPRDGHLWRINAAAFTSAQAYRAIIDAAGAGT